MTAIRLDTEILELIKRLQQMQTKADAQSAHQVDLREQLKVAAEKAHTLYPVISHETNNEVFDLVNRLQQMQDKTDALAEYQFDLKEQLKIAKDKALALHQKIMEELCDVGGEA